MSPALTAAILQDAMHNALMAKGGSAAQFSAFADNDSNTGNGRTKDAFFLRAVTEAKRAGMVIDENITKRTLARKIAEFAANIGINAFRGTYGLQWPASEILADNRGI